MNIEEQNPWQNKLEQQLQGSESLQKFKQISLALQQLKAEMPLTQLCELRWITDDDSLILRCPNLEIRQDLSEQRDKLAQLNLTVSRFIIKYSDLPDITIYV